MIILQKSYRRRLQFIRYIFLIAVIFVISPYKNNPVWKVSVFPCQYAGCFRHHSDIINQITGERNHLSPFPPRNQKILRKIPVGIVRTETYVTEEIYEILRINLAGLMGEKDDYLDVFVQDMVYSDQPIKKSISEDLADIYQDIKDFIFVFQLGLNETMNDSLAICQENFGLLWGQKLVNTLRALHDVKYNQQNENDEEDNEEENNELSDDDYCCEEDGCHCHDDECHCHEDGCHCRNDE